MFLVPFDILAVFPCSPKPLGDPQYLGDICYENRIFVE